jgi:hypothetical protein
MLIAEALQWEASFWPEAYASVAWLRFAAGLKLLELRGHKNRTTYVERSKPGENRGLGRIAVRSKSAAFRVQAVS